MATQLFHLLSQFTLTGWTPSGSAPALSSATSPRPGEFDALFPMQQTLAQGNPTGGKPSTDDEVDDEQ